MPQNLRLACRLLLRSPVFSVLSILTLTIAIGANTAVFSIVDSFLLRSLPFSDPEALVHLWSTDRKAGERELRVSGPTLLDWSESAGAFEGIDGFYYGSTALARADLTESVETAWVTPGLLGLLGSSPVSGRTFLADEGIEGGAPVVVVSERLWRRRLGGTPDIVGRTILLDRRPHEVVGVMPAAFEFPMKTIELWLPVRPDPAGDREAAKFQVVGRLKDGVSIGQAQTEMDAVARRLEEAYPEALSASGVNIVPLREALIFHFPLVRKLLLALAVTALLVLFIACTNVAGAMLSRALDRSREMSIRMAVGAGRAQLVRQLLTESSMVALLGAVGGILFAVWATRGIGTAIPEAFYRVGAIHVGPRALAFTLVLTVVSTFLFGLVPALRASWTEMNVALKEGTISTVGGARWTRWLGDGLVVLQVMLTLALLAGAALMLQSVRRLNQADPGFHPRAVLTAKLSLPRSVYPEPADAGRLREAVLTELRSLGNVEAAAAANVLPLNSETLKGKFVPVGQESLEDRPPSAIEAVVTPGYFEVLGIPLLSGRAFEQQDGGGPPVVVINRTLARSYFAGRDPVGSHLRLLDHDEAVVSIVGVVADVRHEGLHQPIEPQVYMPYSQQPVRTVKLLARTSGDPRSLAGAMRRAVGRFDSGVALEIRSMDEIVAESLSLPRLLSNLLSFLAVAALVLATMGVYGMVSQVGVRRRREIGVRLALGASRRDILARMLRRGGGPALVGVVLGVPAGLAIAQLLRNFLYEVGTADPLTFVVVTAFILGVALLASYLPARSAASLDPTIVLRSE
ncbi:MAG TPA: ABC transporter permease [Longimicrobiaceae bacterium]|nr:ABC transporter permease [Longimicrobiaceae bacterium]